MRKNLSESGDFYFLYGKIYETKGDFKGYKKCLEFALKNEESLSFSKYAIIKELKECSDSIDTTDISEADLFSETFKSEELKVQNPNEQSNNFDDNPHTTQNASQTGISTIENNNIDGSKSSDKPSEQNNDSINEPTHPKNSTPNVKKETSSEKDEEFGEDDFINTKNTDGENQHENKEESASEYMEDNSSKERGLAGLKDNDEENNEEEDDEEEDDEENEDYLDEENTIQPSLNPDEDDEDEYEEDDDEDEEDE